MAGLVGGNQLWPGGKKVRRQKGRCSDGGGKGTNMARMPAYTLLKEQQSMPTPVQ